MKTIALASAFILCACQSPKVAPGQPQTRVAAINSTWPGVDYAEIRAYRCDPFAAHRTTIVEGGCVAPTASPRDGRILSQAQTHRLMSAIKGEYTPHFRARCHRPRHGFVFFDKTDSPVAHLSVCFECGTYTSSPQGNLGKVWNLGAIKGILEELQLWP